MAALVWSLKEVEEIVEGKPLRVFTDHSALVWLFNSTENKTRYNQRILVWALYLQQWKHNVTIIHRPGRTHLNADTLSRYPVASTTPCKLRKSTSPSDLPPSAVAPVARVTTVEMQDDFRKKWINGYQDDPHWKELYAKLKLLPEDIDSYHSYRLDPTGLIYYNDTSDPSLWKLCVPSCCHVHIFNLAHDQLGHPSARKTYERLSRSYHMPSLSKRLKSYIRECPSCAISKAKDKSTGLLVPLQLPKAPCKIITMDFISGIQIDQCFDTILTITDKFSKFVTLIPAKASDGAEETAKRWMDSYYCRFGLPLGIVSDRDVRFTALFWKSLFKSIGCNLLMSTSFSPQTDGQSERTNQTIEVMLRSVIGYETTSSWLEKLPLIEYAINSQASEPTGHSPFHVLYGFNPRDLTDTFNRSSSFPDHDLVNSRMQT